VTCASMAVLASMNRLNVNIIIAKAVVEMRVFMKSVDSSGLERHKFARIAPLSKVQFG
jgi:hypothetical protein